MLTKLIGIVAAVFIPANVVGPAVEKGLLEIHPVVKMARDTDRQLRTKRELANVITQVAPRLDIATVELYTETIFVLSKQYEIDPVLIMAMIWQESRFQHDAISGKGARGLLQIMPRTGSGLGVHPDDLFDPVTNLQTGIKYLDLLQKKYGNLRLSIIAYNQGEGNVDRNRYHDGYYTKVMTHYQKMNGLLRES
ncbi:lytic transglycosylase domain-containing protein [Brevibacillus sp. HB1.4B]|uniref:lytic transglycosylase domain-containing protein n=1 Tax=Brevibacillus TaxID=55080 RepID=UPI000361C3A1|nr:lytic murein transglycosylase [Brevibacillus brevis X23]NRS17028.1 lytic transglycosylase domain-containing protein [Brevibacillus sp. HB1.4B]NTU30602.1 lytic transglycosylase domain-containing protein [Brevibacillus sp. HB1.1]